MFTDIAEFFQKNKMKLVGLTIILLFFITAGSRAIYVQLYLINKYQKTVDELIANES